MKAVPGLTKKVYRRFSYENKCVSYNFIDPNTMYENMFFFRIYEILLQALFLSYSGIKFFAIF